MDSIVPVYSIAKTYSAAAALLSFDQQDPIGRYLNPIFPALGLLTVRDLLMHRSGLNDYGGWDDYRAAVRAHEDPWPIDEILARAELHTPGAFRYSNIGYLLIRRALEHHHGKPYFQVLNDLVLSPLDIDAAPFATRADWSVCTHPSIGDELRRYHPGWVYTGTFAARVGDAARGIALLMSGQLGENLAATMRDTLPVDVPGHPMAPAGYGLGLMTSGLPASLVGHGGGGPGFSLFAAATADGQRWHGAVSVGEGEDLQLIRSCIDALSQDTGTPETNRPQRRPHYS